MKNEVLFQKFEGCLLACLALDAQQVNSLGQSCLGKGFGHVVHPTSECGNGNAVGSNDLHADIL